MNSLFRTVTILLLAVSVHSSTNAQSAGDKMYDAVQKFVENSSQYRTKKDFDERDVAAMRLLYDKCKASLENAIATSITASTQSLYAYYQVNTAVQTAIMPYQLHDAATTYQLLHPLVGQQLKVEKALIWSSDRGISERLSSMDHIEIKADDLFMKIAGGFYFLYIASCQQLGKYKDADIAYNQFLTTDYNRVGYYVKDINLVPEYIVEVGKLIVEDKVESKTYDSLLFRAAVSLVEVAMHRPPLYEKKGIPIGRVIDVLRNSLLADQFDLRRADAFFNLQTEMSQNVAYFTKEQVASIFAQSLRSATDLRKSPFLMDYFLNFGSVGESIVKLNDSFLLQHAINLGEHFLETDKKNRSPYLYKNLSELYEKAGEKEKQLDAEKKFKKYKYW